MVAHNEINRGHRQVDAVVYPQADPPAHVEVLVVGAGPSGLGTALDLNRHGVAVAVVEANSEHGLPRAGAFGHSARVVELFEKWGVAGKVRRNWTFPPEWNLGHRVVTSLNGHVLNELPRRFSNRHGGEFSFVNSIRRPQTALQQAFLEQLDILQVPVAGRWKVTRLEQDAEGVTVAIEHVGSGEQRTVRASYVVGADGARSTARQLSGIEREGEYATERHFRFVVRTSGEYRGGQPFPSGTNIVVNAEHAGHLAALSETDWRVYAGPYPIDAPPSTDELLELARSAFGGDVELELVDVTSYFKSTRIAESFRKDRVFLVGDAAHVRTPGGNLGEGFGDVANLGWKLAAVLRGQGGDVLLDSYDQERRPHNWRVARHARDRADISERNVADARALGFPADGDHSQEATRRRQQIAELLRRDVRPNWGVQFDERYDTSSVLWYDEGQLETETPWNPAVYVPDGKPGHRAPNGTIDPFGGTLYDRIGSHVALLVLTEDPSAVSLFEQAAHERGIDLEVIYLRDGEAQELYGAPFALIRPDTHVAWRGDARALDAGAVLDRVYGRQSVADEVSSDGLVGASV